MYKKESIRIISKGDRNYPPLLLEIPDPPEKLYCTGDVKLLGKPSLAVVGSRKCSEYGRRVAIKTGSEAARNNLVVVSGMAKGIDSFGHLGALNAGGKTIAVLGCGVDVCYPKENRKIYERIAAEGLIISEYPPGTEPAPYTFPQRNRIISGLSAATVVVEAGTNSGALITAEIAAAQGREVFAVPGNITSQYSLGTNKLIADGARPIAVIDDIFTAMGLTPAVSEALLEELGADEQTVYSLIKENGEVSVDFICRMLDKTPVFVNGIVTVLEMKGLVAYNLGKIFVAKF
ncbi:MAG: DNA-processing protein DprA [Firmicutes bacterium]|nr:DNA-processing protein DprA [Bacillota bacterium]